jgi:hypothetical protein
MRAPPHRTRRMGVASLIAVAGWNVRPLAGEPLRVVDDEADSDDSAPTR